MRKLNTIKRLTSFALAISLILVLSPVSVPANSINPVFNDPPSSNGLEQSVVDLIDGADDYVYLAVYSMNSENVVESLVNAHEREGVDVKVVTEKDNRNKGGSYSGFENAYERLSDAGIPIKTDGRSSLMHHKFVVVDDAEVFMGSVNFTEKQFNGDKNNGMVVDSSEIAHHYKQEFEEMWGGKFGTAKTNDPVKSHTIDGHNVTSGFAPGVEGTDQIVDVLNTADHHVYFNIFTFTHQDVANRLTQLHDNGVDVRGTFDAWQGTDSYYVSKIFDQLTADSVPVRLDDYHGLLHSKYIVVDGNTNSDPVVLAGSYNWTNSADDSNDENFLIVKEPSVVNQFHENAKNVYENHAQIPSWQENLTSIINVNTADASTLQQLDGIGSVSASSIVNHRESNGPFTSIDKLTEVTGIGSVTVNKIEDQVTVGDVTTEPLNINQATAEEFLELKGIGSVTARNIVNYRSTKGDFSSIGDLTNVSGIGSSTLSDIEDEITVGSDSGNSDAININTASKSTLSTLDKIGSITAQNIIDNRTNNGDFLNKSDITRVDGIGSTTYDSIKSDITVGDVSGPININGASASTLEQLDGIGSVTAQKIVAERDVNGQFATLDDLTRVDGIGMTTVDNNRENMTVGDNVKININSASKSALESLSGIGPSTAQNILDYRLNQGDFSDKSEIKQVNGIGNTTFELIKEQITT